MNDSPPAIVDLVVDPAAVPSLNGNGAALNGDHAANGKAESRNGYHVVHPPRPVDAEVLRRVAWEVGERRAGDHFLPTGNHAALAPVHPYQGFLHWRIRQDWIDRTAWEKGNAWTHCALIVRLYDVSFVEFNGLNAHHMFDLRLPAITGQLFFHLPRPGTWQLAEVGFLLRSGEFVPAARSFVSQFPSDAVSPRHSHAALLVDDKWRVEEVGNLWEQDKVLSERRRAKLKKSLNIAAFAFEAQAAGHPGLVARFVSELAASQAAQGHRVHVFLPADRDFTKDQQVSDVSYHPLDLRRDGSPLDQAIGFARAAEKRMQEFGPFDLLHLHEWMTGLAPWIGTRPTVLSLSSIEAIRRNGKPPSQISQEIQQTECALAHAVGCILTPDWLRDRAIHEFGVADDQVHPFPMEARLPSEWDCPLDFGRVKKDIGLGPLDRVMVFVGPLEHGAGVDILLEALPTLLHRSNNVRLAFAGSGSMHGHLEHRAGQLGVGHAVRVLGHVERHQLVRLVRSAEALVLPSRHRVPWDDAVVDLARQAGRPVVTTVGGPAHLVKHDHNGIVTYDNPGSMVWAIDQILHNSEHAQRMGENGKRSDGPGAIDWSGVAKHYLELCALSFPELRSAD